MFPIKKYQRLVDVLFPLISHGFPLVFPNFQQFSPGFSKFPMVFPWFFQISHGFPLISTVFPQFSPGFPAGVEGQSLPTAGAGSGRPQSPACHAGELRSSTRVSVMIWGNLIYIIYIDILYILGYIYISGMYIYIYTLYPGKL